MISSVLPEKKASRQGKLKSLFMALLQISERPRVVQIRPFLCGQLHRLTNQLFNESPSQRFLGVGVRQKSSCPCLVFSVGRTSCLEPRSSPRPPNSG